MKKFGPYQTQRIKNWDAYLKASTETLTRNFEEIIEKYKFENNSNKAPENKAGKIEFWHNADEFDMAIEVSSYDYDMIEEMDFEKPLFPSYSAFPKDYILDFLYPKDFDVYYEDQLVVDVIEEKSKMFFAWFAQCWSNSDGQNIGIKTETIENSVGKSFNLIYMNWNSNINTPDREDGKKYDSPLKRKLTEFEIRTRVNFVSRAGKGYKIFWRYLDRGDEFYDIGCYNKKVFLRKGKIADMEYLEFEEMHWDRYELCRVIDNLCNQGFYEKARPMGLKRVHPNCVEWEFAAQNRSGKAIEKVDFHGIESELSVSLPRKYKWFIQRMNYSQSLNPETHTRIEFQNWHLIDKFYSPEEVIVQTKNLLKIELFPQSYFTFGSTKTGIILAMNCETEEIYAVQPGQPIRKIAPHFQEFLENCRLISPYFSPLGFHIENGNLEAVKLFLKNGWDVKENNSGRGLLNYSYRDDMNILFLEHGVDPNTAVIYHDTISRKYLLSLIEYGLDFQKKLDEDKWLKIRLAEREEFNDILENYN